MNMLWNKNGQVNKKYSEGFRILIFNIVGIIYEKI